MRRLSYAVAVAVFVGGHVSCADDGSSMVATSAAATASAAGTGGAGGHGSGGGGLGSVGVGGFGGGGGCDPGDPSVDDDQDGFTELEGDCNDCDVNANPDAIEFISESGAGGQGPPPADEDCDGLVDEPPESCDAGLLLESLDASKAARSLELCQMAGEGVNWGLVDAAYVNGDGTPASPTVNVGLMSKFGTQLLPRAGQRMLALSSGHARDSSHPDACGTGSCSMNGAGVAPPGFPQAVQNCAAPIEIRDDVTLQVALQSPANAHGYAFDFVFFSFEYPKWVCTAFNDQFVAIVTPPPMGSIQGNIAFDSNGSPPSVNLGYFPHCYQAGMDDYALICSSVSPPCPPTPNPYCAAGAGLLLGTGFDINETDSGSTGWLTTTAPISPGAPVTIRFAIWDTNDSSLDSTVLIDNFRWLSSASTVGTVPVPN